MAEETKNIRLSKAAKEFNIAVSTVVEYLVKKGHEIDSNPNSKISEEEYILLKKEFQSDKVISEEAKKIKLEMSQKKAAVSMDVLEVEEKKEDDFPEDKDLIIKTVEMDTPLVKKTNRKAKEIEEKETVEEKAVIPEKKAEKSKTDKKTKEEKNEKIEKVSKSIKEEKETKPTKAVEKEEKKEESKNTVKPDHAKTVPVEIVVEKVVDKLEGITEESKKTEIEVPMEETTVSKKTEAKNTEAKNTIVEKHTKEGKVKDEKEKELVPTSELAPVLENITEHKESAVGVESGDSRNMGAANPEGKHAEHPAEHPAEKQEEKQVVKANENPVEKQEKQEEKIEKIEEQEEKIEEIKITTKENPPVEEVPIALKNSVEEEIAKKEEKKDMADFRINTKVAGPKIIGTMDTATFELAKRGKTAKTHSEPKEHKKSQQHQHTSSAKPVAVVTSVVENKVEKVEEIILPVEDKDKENNFIKTVYTKLEGPKITGEKIDLTQFMKKPKPVASSKDNSNIVTKKKRKRIKGEGTPNVGNVGVTSVPQPNTSGKTGKNWPKKDNRKSNNKKEPVQVNDQEIEKQIKETLARLSPLGKSKASKHRREKRQTISHLLEEEHERQLEEQKVLKVTEFVTVNELATMMEVPVTDIISTCMSLGLFVSINQRLTADPISLLAEEYGYKVEFVDAEVLDELEHQDDFPEGENIPRTPIVTVMGHVDHGKTSLLDYIRKTNVIAGEAGGITQHIGAYEVQLDNGKKITFLDTPGHEAFTAMRARGAKVTDIAIVVIAADDKVMPQTIEAINHAQAAGVPIIFAINKIDKPGADPEKIKAELAEMNLLVEDWGGKYQSQDISAKKGVNVDVLLEKVLLEAEILDLKANPSKRAKGTVIESALDKGRGYVAKILVQDGSVSISDFILAGSTYGRVKAMYNERNQLIRQAGPSVPILLLGLNGAPQAGDIFNVIANEKEAKDISNRRLQLQREQGLRTQKHITLDEIGRRIAIGDFKELNVIVKGDVDGSIEALSDSLLKLSSPEVQVNVIHQSVGQITESDVLLASASEAIIIGFQVRPSLAARKLAENEQIDIRLYSIIYDAIDEIKDAIEGMLSPEIQERIVANLEVREVFKINKVGTIAGCIVLDGRLGRQTKIRIIRDGIVIHTGKLGSLRRFKDEVKEVLLGQDCGLNIENFNDIKMGDIIEGYDQTEVKRTL
ncbi:MAG: translation initiation factor IF-2 [Bacteroidales bacterium]